jgi:hypothetical protein
VFFFTEEGRVYLMTQAIFVTDHAVVPTQIAFGVPWNSDAACYNMKFPKESLNINDYEGDSWMDALGDGAQLQALYIDCDLTPDAYRALGKFTGLEQLFLYTAKELEDISFILNMPRLKYLYISDSKISDLTPVVLLLEKQEKIRNSMKKSDFFERLGYDLDNVAIVHGRIASLEPFANVQASISDLNLAYNQIVDLTPLAGLDLYYFTVSHNQVEDLEAFMKVHPCSYMLYARWNRIKSIEFMRDRTDLYDYSRLFLHHNEITDYTPLKGYDFVYTDVERDEIEPAE